MSELFEMPIELNIPDGVLPNKQDLTYYHLEKDRKIYLDFDVDERVLHIQKLILRWNKEDEGKPVEERTPIRIYIMSCGGSITFMWSLIDTIMLSETPVHTINVGLAASAAGLIFMAGKRRYMLPTATVLIHEGAAELSGDAIKVMDQADSYKISLKKMKEYILRQTKIPTKELNKKRANDWQLDSQYCLKNEVCTNIVTSLTEIV